MREIKYQAWDVKRKTMYSNEDLVFYDQENTCLYSILTDSADKQLIFMQYTGLQDKNGKEIYENDITYFDGAYCIVRFGEHGVPSIEDMEYVDMATGFYLEPQETIEPFNMTVPLNDLYVKELVVIGNIFEHSHLLEQHHDN